MSIEKTKKLISTRSEENANRLLVAGWTLLLVGDRHQGEYQWVHYLLGWQHESEPQEITFIGIEDGPEPF